MSNNLDFKVQGITRDKEGHFIIIKGSLQEEDIIVPNLYAPNNMFSKYTNQKFSELKEDMNKYIIIMEDF